MKRIDEKDTTYSPWINDLVKQNTRFNSYVEYIASSEWKKKRQEALDFHGHKCIRCSSTSHLVVHHKHYKTVGKEEMSDFTILCFDCHNKVHAKRQEWKNDALPEETWKEYDLRKKREKRYQKKLRRLERQRIMKEAHAKAQITRAARLRT